MNKIMLAAVPGALALAACNSATNEETAPTETVEVAAEDDDTAQPVAAPAPKDEKPHDESVPHDH